jgi:hypothetical protein
MPVFERVPFMLADNPKAPISGDSKTPSPAFLQALNPATLVIIPAAPPRIELQTPPKNVQPKVPPGALLRNDEYSWRQA